MPGAKAAAKAAAIVTLVIYTLIAFQNCSDGGIVINKQDDPSLSSNSGAKVTSVSPSAALAVGGGTVIITGSGFMAGAVATINGLNCSSPALVDSIQITCVVPAAAAGSISQVDVSVSNPGATAATLAKSFYYLGAPSLWLRADLGVTQAAGAVSAWADQSGIHNNATQSNSGTMPVFVAASPAFNNMPVIQFNGGGQHMALANLGLLNNVGGATVSIAASVASQSEVGALLVYTANNAAVSGTRFYLRTNSGCSQVGSASGPLGVGGRTLESDATCEEISGGPLTANVAFESTGIIDYAKKLGALSLNGTVVSTSATFQDGTNTSPTNSQAADLGAFSGANFFNGSIAEILMYSFAVTADQQLVLDSYLKKRYGLP